MSATTTEYERALSALDEALKFYDEVQNNETAKKIARDACIQRFEFCIELAWKTGAKMMGSTSTAANIVIRELARNGLIHNPEVWFEFVKARNLTSHTYNEKVAQIVFAQVTEFLPAGRDLLARLQSR